MLAFVLDAGGGKKLDAGYKANTRSRLVQSLNASGLRVPKTIGLRQQRPYWRNSFSLEKIFMQWTPINVLLVCAHKVAAK